MTEHFERSPFRDDVLDLIGNKWDRISHGPTDMVCNGNPADLRQMPVDLLISAIGREKCETNRGSFVDKPQLGLMLTPFGKERSKNK